MLNPVELPQRKSLLQSLAKALGIYPGEGQIFLLLFGQAFWLGVMMICFYAASNALFLAEFGSAFVPYIYIASGTINIAVGLLFVQLERRLPFSILLIGTLGFLVISVSALWLGLWLKQTAWLIFGVMAWMRVVWVLVNLELWALSGRLFNVRQGKRLFPMIGAGAILGIIVAGLSTSILVNLFGTVNLLLVAGISLLFAFGFLLATLNISRTEPISPVQHETPNDAQAKTKPLSLRGWFQNRYIMLFFISSAFSVFGSYMIEFGLFTEASLRYDNAADIGSFFGNYLGFSTLFVLVIALFTGRLFDRFGLKAGILFNPILVGAGIIVTLAGNAFWTLGPLLFWLVVITKFADDVLLGLNNAGRNILYQPLPDSRRVRVQTVMESMLVPFCVGLVGVMLLLVNTVGGLDTITVFYLLLVIWVIWLATAFLLDKEYAAALKQALSRRQFQADNRPLTIDSSGLAILRRELNNPRPGAVLYALELLADNDPDSFRAALPQLLNHTAPEVRQSALERLAQNPMPAALPAVRAMISGESNPAVRGVALRTLAVLGQTESVPDLTSYLHDSTGPALSPSASSGEALSNGPVITGAMVGLLKHGGMEGNLLAGQRLWQMVNSTQAAERTLAAQVLGEIGVQTFSEQVAKLLADPELQVQRAALTAAGQLKQPTLWPLVIDKLTSPHVGQAAQSALIQGKETALPALTQAFGPLQKPPSLLIRLAQVMGQIRGKAAITCLNAHLDVAHPTLRSHIFKALSHCGYQAQKEEVPRLEQQIREEVEEAVWLLTILLAIEAQQEAQQPAGETLSFLQMALKEHLNQNQTRIFYLLSFIYDTQSILRAKEVYAYRFASSREKGYALEMIDVLLPRKLRDIVFPLLQPLSPCQQLNKLSRNFPQTELDFKQSLHALIQDKRATAWLRSCALYTLVEHPQPNLSGLVEPWLTAPDPLLRETAWLALSRNEPLTPAQLELLRRDSVPSIVQLAGQLTSRKKLMLSTLERIVFLKGIALFAQIPGEDLIRVAQVATEVTFSPNEIFIRQGDLGDCLYIVVAGQAQVIREDAGQVAVLGEQDVIGDMAILAGTPRTAGAVALTEITALKIERGDFQDLMTEKPELALEIIKVLVHRLEEASRKVAH